MTFINEYVSKEDIGKYQLDDLWKRTHLGQTKLGGRYSWTLDKGRNIFLMFIRSGHEMETADNFTFLLWWDGGEIYLHLEREGNADFRKEEGQGIWHLRRLDIPPNFEKAAVDQIKEVAKEALTEYGYMGVNQKVQKYFVNFSF